jgi:hypothetical protein
MGWGTATLAFVLFCTTKKRKGMAMTENASLVINI